MKYSQPIWKMVLNAAKEIDKEIFASADIVEKVHETYPEVPVASIRTYVIAMAPNHPSSKIYPSTHKLHGCFDYLGNGKFKLKQKEEYAQLPPIPQNIPTEKEEFLSKYKQTIISWAITNKALLVSSRRNYGWNNKSLIDALTERNQISRSIVLSRIKNNGGLDIETVNKVMTWGGLQQIKLENNKALEITSKAFAFLDSGDIKGATLSLLSINGIGIASASKIIGLFDQDQFAIYDSRVGTALRTLQYEGKRLIKCPMGRTRAGDLCSHEQWAEDYEKLIWILEVISNWLNEQSYPFSIADVEMALFMMGK